MHCICYVGYMNSSTVHYTYNKLDGLIYPVVREIVKLFKSRTECVITLLEKEKENGDGSVFGAVRTRHHLRLFAST